MWLLRVSVAEISASLHPEKVPRGPYWPKTALKIMGGSLAVQTKGFKRSMRELDQ